MWPFSRKSADKVADLRTQSIAVMAIIEHAFDSPGPLHTPERRQILSAWLTNFARNLGAACTAMETGRDMAGQPISQADIRQGLKKMCQAYGSAQTIKRLEDVCGSKVRIGFERVLSEVRATAS